MTDEPELPAPEGDPGTPPAPGERVASPQHRETPVAAEGEFTPLLFQDDHKIQDCEDYLPPQWTSFWKEKVPSNRDLFAK